MKQKILIVEDQFVEANYLRMMLTQAQYQVTGIAYSVLQAQEMILKERPDFVLLDIFLKGKLTGIDLAKELAKENIAFVYLSANSNEEILNLAKATKPYGFLIKPFREKDLLITLSIAQYRHEHSVDAHLRREQILKDQLTTIIKNKESWEDKVLQICKTLQPYIAYHYVTVGFNSLGDDCKKALSYLRIGFNEYQKIGINELATISGLSQFELTQLANNTTFEEGVHLYTGPEFNIIINQRNLNQLFSRIFQLQSCISFPLPLSNNDVFNFCFYGNKKDTYNPDHINLLNRLQEHMSTGIETLLDIQNHVKTSQTETTCQSLISDVPKFATIVGKSQLLLNVFDLITQVAPTDTSVLILGESGTGKERIADCIHNLSSRKGKPFIKVNCAALPATLIESELFGHEKGAFTGAYERRIGKFEKANHGTIFLDEIGEMPIELQVKLLRVLQEKYIERIGAKDVTKLDVRIIAATNRKLEKEVAEGRFRLDLYYRLNVFPIELPPLRERIEDISLLANHFIQYFNHKAGRNIKGISEKVIDKMKTYSWPGNIRELENLMERSVLLSKGSMIEELSLPNLQKEQSNNFSQEFRIKTIHENERDYIITVLKKCNGRIWGIGGAAEVLNLPPSTLKSKMKKLGIRKEYVE